MGFTSWEKRFTPKRYPQRGGTLRTSQRFAKAAPAGGTHAIRIDFSVPFE
jgi:hypothetical protein